MPYRIEMAGDSLRLELDGDVDAVELEKLGQDVLALEETLGRAPHRFIDLSKLSGAHLDFGVLSNFADLRRRHAPSNPFRAALYAPEEIQFGFARMYELLNPHELIRYEVFRDRKAAEDWIAAADD